MKNKCRHCENEYNYELPMGYCSGCLRKLTKFGAKMGIDKIVDLYYGK